MIIVRNVQRIISAKHVMKDLKLQKKVNASLNVKLAIVLNAQVLISVQIVMKDFCKQCKVNVMKLLSATLIIVMNVQEIISVKHVMKVLEDLIMANAIVMKVLVY